VPSTDERLLMKSWDLRAIPLPFAAPEGSDKHGWGRTID